MPWSSVDLSSHCLADNARTQLFIDALAEVVKPGDTVLDAGAGSGVLAARAAMLGAGQVIAVEKDPFLCKLLEWTLADQGVKVKVMCGDVAEVTLPYCDVVVAELVDVWFLEEDLMSIIGALCRRDVIDKRSRILPAEYTFDLAFGRCEWNRGYSSVKWPYYEWAYYNYGGLWSMPSFEVIKEAREILSIDVHGMPRSQGREISIYMEVEGALAQSLERANALRLSGSVRVFGAHVMRASGAMNASLIVPSHWLWVGFLERRRVCIGRYVRGIKKRWTCKWERIN